MTSASHFMAVVAKQNLLRSTLLASLLSKILANGVSLQDVSSSCMGSNIVSVQAVYWILEPVISDFILLKVGTAALTNAKILPTPRQLHCYAHKGYAVCVKELQAQC